MPTTDRQRLDAGLEALAIAADEAQRDRLMAYLDLLIRWNRAYNLTAVRDPSEMVGRHLLDSLSIANHVSGDRILDVGSGAGLPGIPLACVQPARQFTLLDSNGKKTRFLTQAVAELGLENVTVVQQRIEEFRSDIPFPGLTARAFSSLPDMLTSVRHLLASNGLVFAMKGVFPDQELAAVPPDYRVRETVALTVPGVEGERHLIIVERSPGPERGENGIHG